MGIGIDIVQMARFADKPKLVERILGSDELSEFYKRHESNEFVAGHFAAKEAFIKAGADHLKLPLHEIQILYYPDGKPFISAGGNTYNEVSISHDGGMVVAVVYIPEKR